MYDSAQRGGKLSRDIAGLVTEGLKAVHAEATKISAIVVNIGPGGLSYVRSGVSFANALAFSLGIPIYPFNSFEILGHEADSHISLPLLSAIPAANDTAYVGVVRSGAVQLMRFGPLPLALAQTIDGLVEIAIAGRMRERITSLLSQVKVVDTRIERPDVRALLEMGYSARDAGTTPVSQVIPLTEQAPVFYEQT